MKTTKEKYEARFMGVCAAIANHLDVEVWIVRAIFLILMFTTHLPMVVLYIVVGLFCI